MADVTSVTTPANPGMGVPAYNLVDLFGSYDLNDKWQLRAGVTNVADKDSGARVELADEHRHGGLRRRRPLLLPGLPHGHVVAGAGSPNGAVRRSSGNELRLRCRAPGGSGARFLARVGSLRAASRSDRASSSSTPNAALLRRWYTGEPSQIDHDATKFPDCAAAAGRRRVQRAGNESPQRVGADEHWLYVSNHGGREAIEVFR